MAETILTIEGDELCGGISGRELRVITFCGPEHLKKTEESKMCVQIVVETRTGYATIQLTRSQALELAQSIVKAYE